jgi:hypothetical protein
LALTFSSERTDFLKTFLIQYAIKPLANGLSAIGMMPLDRFFSSQSLGKRATLL